MAFSILTDRSPILLIAISGLFAIFLHRIYSLLFPKSAKLGFPLIQIDGARRDGGQNWQTRAQELLAKGEKTTSGPFQIWAGTEEVVVIPNRFADELKDAEAKLGFVEAVARDFPVYPGFETFKASNDGHGVLAEMTRTKLTQSFGGLITDMVEECNLACRQNFPESNSWSVSTLKDDAIQIIARLSTRIFLGPDMSSQKAWLDLSKDCTIESFIAASKIRLFPELIRYIAVWFIPECRKVRDQLTIARGYITEEVQRRAARAKAAVDAGEKPTKPIDAMEWLNELKGQKGRVMDQTLMQMGFTVAGLHTTNEALCNAILDLCRHPEAVEPLRREITSVLSSQGWSQKSLFQLKLLDSFLKESNRTSPLERVSMNRVVRAPIRLSDGSVLPAGTRITVLPDYNNPAVYPEPEKFVYDRHVEVRFGQHVTMTPEHLYFGYGRHACPGRFFASAELKIALCFLLLRYEWEVEGGQELGLSAALRPVLPYDCKVRFRSREAEVDLMAILDR